MLIHKRRVPTFKKVTKISNLSSTHLVSNIRHQHRYNRKFQTSDVLLNSFESTYGTTYDYLSVMHYGSYAFSINNERTIETKNEKYQNLIGNRATFTSSDMNYINILYSYSEDDLDASRCTCNAFDISGFQIQHSTNGHYSINNSLFNQRIRFKILHLNA